MNFVNFFKISYYFDSALGYTFTGFWVLVIVLVLLLIASTIVSTKAGKWNFLKRTIAIRLTRAGFLVGWIGLAYLFVRYQAVPYFNWRLWPALLGIYLIIELVYLWRFIKKDYPKLQAKKKGMGDKDLYLKKFTKKR